MKIKLACFLLLLLPFSLNAGGFLSSNTDLAKECVLLSKKVNQLSEQQSDTKCIVHLQYASSSLDMSADNLFKEQIDEAKNNLKSALSYLFYTETYECAQLEQIHMAGEEVRNIQSKL